MGKKIYMKKTLINNLNSKVFSYLSEQPLEKSYQTHKKKEFGWKPKYTLDQLMVEKVKDSLKIISRYDHVQ